MKQLVEFKQPTMSSREIAELVGKRHDHVVRDIENMLRQLKQLGITSPQIWGDVADSYGRPQKVAYLDKDLTLTLVSGYNVAMRHKIIVRWRELEEQNAKPDSMEALLADPERLGHMLIEYAQQKRRLRETEENLRIAVQTKAEIGSRREATAMNTASQLSKEVEKLKGELGDNRTWKQAKAINWLPDQHWSKWGKRLAKLSRELGYHIKEIPDTKYGKVNAYHVEVIEELKQRTQAPRKPR